MTVAEFTEPPVAKTDDAHDALQRFVFHDVDWAFYKEVNDRVQGHRTFVTYCKGRLELVTTSLLHESISKLLAIMIWVLAEELDVGIGTAGRTTLRREDIEVGTEPDESFYIANEPLMRRREQIVLPIDPPPDLAVEVEVTRRLGDRRSIYESLGIPEIWVFGADSLGIFLRQVRGYSSAERSPSFPLLSPAEMTSIVRSGLSQNQTAFTKSFRRRVQEAIAQQQR